jgi:hypothetical protein
MLGKGGGQLGWLGEACMGVRRGQLRHGDGAGDKAFQGIGGEHAAAHAGGGLADIDPHRGLAGFGLLESFDLAIADGDGAVIAFGHHGIG